MSVQGRGPLVILMVSVNTCSRVCNIIGMSVQMSCKDA